MYDIKFSDKIGKLGPTQFEIKNIVLNDKFKNENTREEAILDVIWFVPTDSQEYARNILNLLCKKVYEEKLIRFTEIYEMTQDDALEMFVRFNSDGVSLKKSEITMSILEAYWPSAKTQFGDLLIGDYEGFDTDFIIRSAHMIYGDVVKSNISKQVADDLKNNWISFRKAFENTADLLKDSKINMQRFKNSWNVLVPIIFCVYYNPNYDFCKEGILSYLYRAIFFTYFKSGTTGKLQIMKKYIISYDYEISIEMLNDINELKVNDAKIEDLMNYEKGSRIAGELLYYLSLDWYKEGLKYEQDHLHPNNRFFQAPPAGISMQQWAEWRKMANRIPNLHLLVGRENTSKSDMSLQEYYDDMTETEQIKFKRDSYIPENVSLDILDFEKFYNLRKEILIFKIKELLK